ncbi:hypothetical protein K438DRAFT_1925272 [Mycena galopus ATCC 62051]|nr:hypothetical protein K438DRAFT_1925272 [Mycena galopus ATCC 62051]
MCVCGYCRLPRAPPRRVSFRVAAIVAPASGSPEILAQQGASFPSLREGGNEATRLSVKSQSDYHSKSEPSQSPVDLEGRRVKNGQMNIQFLDEARTALESEVCRLKGRRVLHEAELRRDVESSSSGPTLTGAVYHFRSMETVDANSRGGRLGEIAPPLSLGARIGDQPDIGPTVLLDVRDVRKMQGRRDETAVPNHM